ncbi:4-amino-4-deoxychorismate lyase [gamma proteobacterium HdN1]|nr:4-amino-4-deoxychorismate lyase [gamma proteobacterium HdN1]
MVAYLSLPKHWLFEGKQVLSTVSPSCRGLVYGDGLFETMRVAQGSIPLLSKHLARLWAGLARLRIPPPELEIECFLRHEIRDLDSGVVKLIVMRGEGGRGYLPDPQRPSQLIISLFPSSAPIADSSAEGIAIGISPYFLSSNLLLAGLKHLNRLEQVMCRMALADAGFVEGVVCDAEGFVVEGVSSNLGIWKGGVLETPLLDRAGVAGVARAWALESAPALGYAVRERRIEIEELFAADEVFLCNSLNGFLPVNKINGRATASGPLTGRLHAQWSALFARA